MLYLGDDTLKKDNILPYAAAILKLLQGILTDDDGDAWRTLLNFPKESRDYLAQLGLELHIDELDGYAFLKQPRIDENENAINLPALTVRRRINHLDTSLLLLLREQLYEHELHLPDDNRLFMKYREMEELLLSFWKPQGNAKKQDASIKRCINRIEDMGFIKKVDDRVYRIHPVIKAKLDSTQLLSIRDNLTAYYISEQDNDD